VVDDVLSLPLPGPMLDSADGKPAGKRGGTVCDFLVGPENRLVETVVRSLLDDDRQACNPLYVYGPTGVGKSHLLRGLLAAWKARRHGTATYVSADDFARQLHDAIDTHAVEEFRAKYRGCSLLAIDDIGHLEGKGFAQEELAATLDGLVAAGRQMVLAAAVATAKLRAFSPRLLSRITAGLSLPLSPPGAAARQALLRKMAEVRELSLPEPVVQALAAHDRLGARELYAALLRLEMSARVSKGPITLHDARVYLDEHDASQALGVSDIALATARHFALRLSDLRSPSRRQAVVKARGVAIFLARRLTGRSLEEIGRYFGGRDHTTVLHGYRKTEESQGADLAIQQAIIQIEELLSSRQTAPANTGRAGSRG
jgi:chromosomal replication initiator protein